MKKIFIVALIFSFSLLVGCSLGNTPTSKVEEFLSNYQMLNDNISVSYTNLTDETDLNQDLRKRYEDVVKKQYQNLAYEIKEEEIDGEVAIVTVQIEVMNYKEAIDKYTKTDYPTDEYHNLVLDELEKVKDKITYTIDFALKLTDDDNWEVDALSSIDREKLLGIY